MGSGNYRIRVGVRFSSWPSAPALTPTRLPPRDFLRPSTTSPLSLLVDSTVLDTQEILAYVELFILCQPVSIPK